MKQLKKENGFTLVEALIVGLAVAIIAVAGVWAWKKNDDKPKQANTAVQMPQTTKEDQTASSTQFQRTEASGITYLNIKEWGVRVKLSDKITDAYYLKKVEEADAVHVSLEKYKGTSCAADKTALVVFARFTKDDTNPLAGNKNMTELYPDAIRIGDYYYYAAHRQGACSSDSQTEAATVPATDALMEAGKTFEAIP